MKEEVLNKIQFFKKIENVSTKEKKKKLRTNFTTA